MPAEKGTGVGGLYSFFFSPTFSQLDFTRMHEARLETLVSKFEIEAYVSFLLSEQETLLLKITKGKKKRQIRDSKTPRSLENETSRPFKHYSQISKIGLKLNFLRLTIWLCLLKARSFHIKLQLDR